MKMLESFGIKISAGDTGVQIFPSSTLECWPIRDSQNTLIAYAYGMLLLGHMGKGLSVLDGEIRVDTKVDTPYLFESTVQPNLHGSLIFVTQGEIGRRVYPDFVFSIPIVFCPTSRKAGGSANDILDNYEYDQRFLVERHKKFIKSAGGYGWIPGTMTAHDGVFRVLPNHYLDLESFTTHRFWPRYDEYNYGTTLNECVRESANSVRSFIEACAEQYSCALTLTAGYDSRVMLCGARNVVDKISFITLDIPGEELDIFRAKQICDDLGIRHELKPLIKADEHGVKMWDRMVGDAVQEMNRNTYPTLAMLPNDILLSGVHGSGKTYYYQKELKTINSMRLTPESVASRLGFRGDLDVVSEMAAWMEPISWLPNSAILDLALGELRNGCAAMAQAPIQKAIKPSFLPHAQRSIWARWIEVPPEVKGASELYDDACKILWPEALRYPRNQYGDYRDTLRTMAKLSDISRVRRYVRKRLPR